ncbi:hypothetical protein NDU88_002808 [Pleurodeles waltl]|uniref:Retrotransposon gag domain-containing protein n=1 Tax=Pleurodeles waltl TaxID=8319 RepID=A0AAV7M2R0_PLEWA|nr:hypothetical protein NDU88_002808 [Pleurodeles waltl]
MPVPPVDNTGRTVGASAPDKVADGRGGEPTCPYTRAYFTNAPTHLGAVSVVPRAFACKQCARVLRRIAFPALGKRPGSCWSNQPQEQKVFHPAAGREPFVVEGLPSTQEARWKEWVDRLETYFAATALDNDRRRPMLLHLGGAAIHKLGQSVAEEGPPFTYQSLKQALTAHFEPLVNPDYECFLLIQARQLPHKSVDTFYARLKDLARICTLVDVKDEVCAQFIQGCTSVKLREHILQILGMSMVNILTLGRSKVLSKVHAAHMEVALQTQVKVEPVNAVIAAAADRKNCDPVTLVEVHSLIKGGGPSAAITAPWEQEGGDRLQQSAGEASGGRLPQCPVTEDAGQPGLENVKDKEKEDSSPKEQEQWPLRAPE